MTRFHPVEEQVIVATGRSLEIAISSAVRSLKTKLPDDVTAAKDVEKTATSLTDRYHGSSYCT
jgi:hypothetical protein